jgi:hypothetical protein
LSSKTKNQIKLTKIIIKKNTITKKNNLQGQIKDMIDWDYQLLTMIFKILMDLLQNPIFIIQLIVRVKTMRIEIQTVM